MIIVDCVGHGQPQFLTGVYYVSLGFPIKNMLPLLKKTALVSSSIDALMAVYHSNADNLDQVNKADLDLAYRKIKQRLALKT